MKRKLIQIVSTLGIVLLVSTNLSFMLITESITNPGNNNQFSKNASVNFTEDFTTIAYKEPTSTAVGWGSGVVTSPRDYALTNLGFYPTDNPLRAIEVQGKRVYGVQYNLSSSDDSLNVFDISDPTDIQRTGSRNSMTGQMAIAVEGDAVYVGRADSTPLLASYYYTNPYSIGSHLMNTVCEGNISDIATNGYLVYYTAYKAWSGYSLRLLYAEDPANHVDIAPSWSMVNALGLDVDGNMVFVAASTEGFYTVNVTDKHAFVETGWVNTPGNATDVIVDGNFAYLADGEAGVHIIDISNPALPSILSTFDTDGFARKLVKQGNTLFVADSANGVVVLDVSNPLVPSFVPSPNVIPYVWDVDLYGGLLVVASNAGLHTIRVGIGITNIATTVFPNHFTDFQAWDVRVEGNIAYVVGGSDGFYTLDVSDPNNPILLDQDVIGVTPFYRKLDIQGNHAFIADYGNALRVYDITDPTNIFQTTFAGLTYPTDVCVYGDMAIIADGTFGVYIYNVSDPYSAVLQNNFDIFNNVTAVWMQGPHLYIVDEDGGVVQNSIFIYNMVDIINEVLIGQNSVDAMFYDIWADGDVVYAADDAWMIHYNFTDPTAPVWTSWTNNQSYGVWGFGPYCINVGPNGAALYDFTDPLLLDPILSYYPDATGGKQVTMEGDYTYIANTSSLIILRHFESLADTYAATTAFAQSLEIDTLNFGFIPSAIITNAVHVPPGTNIDYFLSNDGGVTWEPAVLGIEVHFLTKTKDLRWKVELSGPRHASVHLYEITIQYETSIFSPTMIYILAGAGGGLLLVIVLIIVFSAIRKRKKTPTR